ncbi:NADH dehydrogenase [ubiquinone] 1 beta subcomplex subunit 10 [Toxocara canis]|uniref:NADH dehydrogenase [ubiquinone] 1 beta subcomplex subunit 10 n=1 Tax=Toxocara canis TaxID=6265 RepID=A0A0B2V5M6_TOXCA|nr:NADH dehydrogenase [ubiquinone] 1 beta subcomplex subunit 10 [Toxocara canis]
MVHEVNSEGLTPQQMRRVQDRKEWDAYWQIRDLDSQGTFYPRLKYYAHRAFDYPATWFREKVVEPLHDRHRLPYYHRKLNRVPEIDECGVNDKGCYYEANEQFRLDKMVDGYILQILRGRVERCVNFNTPNYSPCAQVIEDLEESELNFFIKYGELGSEADVRDAYMKQKHRMIWERRHPEIMAEREAALKEHKAKLAAGEFDYSFWKKGMFYQDKKNYEPPYEYFLSKPTVEGDKPLSKDWAYYKKLKEDPEFDKEQGKKSSYSLF